MNILGKTEDSVFEVTVVFLIIYFVAQKMSFAAVICQVCEEKLGGVKLKKDQSLAVESLLRRMDVLTVFPTEFGKSLIFRLEVLYKQNVSVLVV